MSLVVIASSRNSHHLWLPERDFLWRLSFMQEQSENDNIPFIWLLLLVLASLTHHQGKQPTRRLAVYGILQLWEGIMKRGGFILLLWSLLIICVQCKSGNQKLKGDQTDEKSVRPTNIRRSNGSKGRRVSNVLDRSNTCSSSRGQAMQCCGIQGPMGPPGSLGQPGPQGLQGIQGVQGIQGSAGVPGIHGTNGIKGQKGE